MGTSGPIGARMAKEQVDWVALDDVMAAADRGLAAVGPELAGFVVLEAALRLREIGGVIDATMIAVGTSGHVAMTSQPRAGDEREATAKLRAVLGELLEVASAPTPSLRQCARRREPTGLATLVRELEGALIPLNRAASRRAVARMARVAVEAIEDGRLEPGSYADARRAKDDSAPPLPVVTDLAPRRPAPPPLPKSERIEPVSHAVDEATPYAASTYEPCGTPPPAHVEATQLDANVEANVQADQLQTQALEASRIEARAPAEPAAQEPAFDDDRADFEVVSHLPPIAEPKVIITDPMAFDARPRAGAQRDRVSELIDSFEVSRRRDDPALSRDLKAMVGIETANPPPVTVHVRARPRAESVDVALDLEPVAASHTPGEPRAPARLGAMSALALVALGAGIATIAARPALLDVVFGSPLPPPGDVAAAAAKPAAPPVAAPAIPIVCEASLTLEGIAAGTEVLRKIGTTPTTITMPMHVPLDLVATLDGMSPRRLHVDASALWQPDPTGPRLDVPFPLEAGSDAKWPSSTGLTPLRAADGARGLLRTTSTPSGAAVWVVTDPAMVSGVPCGAAVDLLVVPPAGTPKPLRVEWTAFTGAPPRATTKL